MISLYYTTSSSNSLLGKKKLFFAVHKKKFAAAAAPGQNLIWVIRKYVMEQQEIVSSKNACQQKFTQQCTVKAKKPKMRIKINIEV